MSFFFYLKVLFLIDRTNNEIENMINLEHRLFTSQLPDTFSNFSRDTVFLISYQWGREIGWKKGQTTWVAMQLWWGKIVCNSEEEDQLYWSKNCWVPVCRRWSEYKGKIWTFIGILNCALSCFQGFGLLSEFLGP